MTREQSVRERAYQLWENEGRPDNRAEEFWERAEAEQAAKTVVPEARDMAPTAKAASITAPTKARAPAARTTEAQTSGRATKSKSRGTPKSGKSS